MPATKNAMTRYMILDQLLSDKYHDYSLDDLTEEVSNHLAELNEDSEGVVRRTIEKDIAYLEYESPFMVEIERHYVDSFNREKQKTYRKKCLRYADPSFSIFKKEMSDDEKYLLSEAISLLGQFDGLPNLEALETFRLGLDVKTPERNIISFTKNPLENSNLLGELFTAISHRQVIELHYHTFNHPENGLVIILHPYLLKEYNRRWFLIGAIEDDDKLMTYPLDRIEKVIALSSYPYKEYKGDVNEMFEEIIGITFYEDRPLTKILFWVSNYSKDYVVTKPLHETQRHFTGKRDEDLRYKYPMLEGGNFFQIECRENYELIRELSSFGKDLLVLQPSEIVGKVYKRIEEMKNNYDNLRTKRS